jgi:hypothetical protein
MRYPARTSELMDEDLGPPRDLDPFIGFTVAGGISAGILIGFALGYLAGPIWHFFAH